MSLIKYRAKRSARKTPEPFGGKPDQEVLRFVIQKHAASHLHYDFRLEINGVLKSWAVPKGPSMDPDVKRLAMMVEDHPFDYRNFEGTIPKGEYGGGTVMIWEQGTYEPAESDPKNKKDREKQLLAELKSGKLKFILHGKKMNGLFALVKVHGQQQNAWLLMKLEDSYTTKEDVTLKDRSVITNRNMEEIAAAAVHDRVLKKKAKSVPTSSEKNTLNKLRVLDKSSHAGSKLNIPAILEKAPKSKFDPNLTPMLATPVDKPFDHEAWQFEVKWDGYRALAFMDQDSVELKSRNGKRFNDKFYPVFEALKAWNLRAVVDGEIVVVNENGIARFSALQDWRGPADGELLFYVFDILWLDGKNLMRLPQRERNTILLSLLPETGIIRKGFSITERGIEFFDVAKRLGLEGIMAKRSDSIYLPGVRSKNWLKIRVRKQQEVIITGYTRNNDSPKLFTSLLLGAYQNGKLKYVGKVGTGFTDKQQKEMMVQFKSLIVKKSPFEVTPNYNKSTKFRRNKPAPAVTWLKPGLVCEINFKEITDDGVFRHPSFLAMREDKKPAEVVIETVLPASSLVTTSNHSDSDNNSLPPQKMERKALLNPEEKTQYHKFQSHEVKFTNLDKLYWPDDGITKRDLLNYYHQVAPYILPYLKDRPESLNRYPDGINSLSFYQKDITGKVPDWMNTYKYHTEDEESRNYLVANDEATLLYMANLGTIEINPWNSTIDEPDNPTWCIIDLDPADKTTFNQVIQAAQVTKNVLDQMNVPSYPKTSGSTGIHIYIPLGAKYNFDQSKEFAKVVVTLVHEQTKAFTSLERTIKSRRGKMYLDFLQNRPGATLAAPYSVRPKPGATVSMPLHWEEVKPGLAMKDFTIFNVMERLRNEGDLFKPVLGEGIDLNKVANGGN